MKDVDWVVVSLIICTFLLGVVSIGHTSEIRELQNRVLKLETQVHNAGLGQ